MDEERQNSAKEVNNLLHSNFRHGYSVPDNYFEGLPATIHERLQGRKSRTLTAAAVFSFWKPAYTAIALILTIITVSGFLFLMQSDRYGHLAGLDESMQMDLVSLYSGIDPYFIYDIVLESGLTVDELEFGLNENMHMETEDFNDYYFLDISSELFWQDALLINEYDQ